MTQEVFNAIDEFADAANRANALTDALCSSSSDIEHESIVHIGFMIADELTKMCKAVLVMEKSGKEENENVQ